MKIGDVMMKSSEKKDVKKGTRRGKLPNFTATQIHKYKYVKEMNTIKEKEHKAITFAMISYTVCPTV